MPSGRVWNPTLHKWMKRGEPQKVNYDKKKNQESWALLISYFRWYPDRLLSILQSDEAEFVQQFIQCLIWRVDARYKETFITGTRGLSKTYTKMTGASVEMLLWPHEKIRYFGPTLDQTAEIVRAAYDQVGKNYPALTNQIIIRTSAKGDFALVTDTGSEFMIKANRGDNSHQVICEECGQEDGIPFDHEKYQTVVDATNRLKHMVNGEPDETHINFKKKYITSACSQMNEAFRYRCDIMEGMISGKSAFAIDIPWTVSVMSGIRDYEYFEGLKKNMTPEKWLRECESIYTGATKDPVVTDLALAKSQVLKVMETEHCGDPDCIYIIGYDVSHEEGANHAKCAVAVTKMKWHDDPDKADLFMKQVVYVNDMSPQVSSLQARYLRNLWKMFSMPGGNSITYIAIDDKQYGKAVTEQLMKDVGDGINFRCINHEYAELEQPDALPVIYPVKASNAAKETGNSDPDGEMIKYAKLQFESGNVQILTPDQYVGVESYKKAHRITTNEGDTDIATPYIKSRELVKQIQNLRIVYRGINWSEARNSRVVQRDMWSAVKYTLRLAQILEKKNLVKNSRKKKDWSKYMKQIKATQPNVGAMNYRSRVVSRRGKIT